MSERGIAERETKKRERERERKNSEVGGFPSQKQNCHKIHTTNAANNSEIEQGRESQSVMTIFVYGIKL